MNAIHVYVFMSSQTIHSVPSRSQPSTCALICYVPLNHGSRSPPQTTKNPKPTTEPDRTSVLLYKQRLGERKTAYDSFCNRVKFRRDYRDSLPFHLARFTGYRNPNASLPYEPLPGVDGVGAAVTNCDPFVRIVKCLSRSWECYYEVLLACWDSTSGVNAI